MGKAVDARTAPFADRYFNRKIWSPCRSSIVTVQGEEAHGVSTTSPFGAIVVTRTAAALGTPAMLNATRMGRPIRGLASPMRYAGQSEPAPIPKNIPNHLCHLSFIGSPVTYQPIPLFRSVRY